jgi:tetratricopeptide (TPR) repeat protein
MLPLPHKIAFLLFALITLALGLEGFYRLYLRIRRGTSDPEPRVNNLPRRLAYALTTTLLQTRTFKKRPTIGLFHSFIFYGFVFYGLVNLVDAIEGYLPFCVSSTNLISATYNLIAVDEMQRLTEATTAYQKAVALVPQYADAHYNLALAYERQGQRRRALRHWLSYVRLDPVGPWAKHAKEQARKILNTEKLSIVSRRGRLVKVAG